MRLALSVIMVMGAAAGSLALGPILTEARAQTVAPAIELGPVPTALPSPGNPLTPAEDERGDPVRVDVDCPTAIAESALRYRISQGLLQAVSQLESGQQRWSVTANGITESFDERDKAVAALDALTERGVAPIRIGCMGIDVAGAANPFTAREDGFNARTNVEMAVSDLVRLHRQTGSWLAAIGRGRSDDPASQQLYRCHVLQELARLRGQPPMACDETALGIESPPAVAGSPRIVNLNEGIRNMPRSDGDGPLIVRGLDDLRALGGLRAATTATPPEHQGPEDQGADLVEVFQSPPALAGGDAIMPSHGITAPANGRTRVQHVTGTEATGTTVRDLR